MNVFYADTGFLLMDEEEDDEDDEGEEKYEEKGCGEGWRGDKFKEWVELNGVSVLKAKFIKLSRIQTRYWMNDRLLVIY